MQTPAPLVEWLTEKVQMHHWGSVCEPRAGTYSWRRHTGGRTTSAGLSAAIEPSAGFALTIEARDIEPAYVMAARNGVITTLLSQSWTPVLKCSITLSAFQPHETESSYAAFYAVAKEATEQLLGISPGATFNIDWSGQDASDEA
jgi:hypothetical protein